MHANKNISYTNTTVTKNQKWWFLFDNKKKINYDQSTTTIRKSYCCQRYSTFWYGLLVGALIVGVILAVVIALWLTSPQLLTGSVTTATTARAVTLRWRSDGITVAGITGQSGNASNRLQLPSGITIDHLRTLYIADSGNNRIQKYTVGASSGTTVAGQMNGTSGVTSPYLSVPIDVAVDLTDNIHIADRDNNRIQFWTSGSFSATTIVGNGNGNNALMNPSGIYRETDSGVLYISDTLTHRILHYTTATSTSATIAGGNGQGTGSTQLSQPTGLHFDSTSNSILIANTMANNVVRWSSGAAGWTLVAGDSNGFSGSSTTMLNNPQDVTIDPMGNVYVADTLNHRVQIFLLGQSSGVTIAGATGVLGSSSNLLWMPSSVALDNQLNLYVADTNNHRIQKFLRY